MKQSSGNLTQRAALVSGLVLGLCVLLVGMAAFRGEAAPQVHAAGQVWAAALSVGHDHSCALTGTGGVKCWGRNNYGQLGDGTTNDALTPVNVTGLTSGVKAIDAGGFHTCALLNNGEVKCWGRNSYGALGNNTHDSQYTPVNVCADENCESSLGGVTAISAGAYFTCALMASGGVKCWGHNSNWQLGDGTQATRLAPVDVVGLSGVQMLSLGGTHACVIVSFGAKCWGDNYFGALGDGTDTDRSEPTDVVGLYTNAVAMDGGDNYTCALGLLGTIMCWGNNSYGKLGDGTTTTSWTPVYVCADSTCDTPLTNVLQMAGNVYHTCAVTANGGAKCWGHNQYGKLGDGTTTGRAIPVDVSGLTSGVAEIQPGQRHTCARMSQGAVKCWGDNAFGQLGDGTTTDSRLPINVSGFANVPTTPTPTSVTPPPTPIPAGAKQIDAGSVHNCAVTFSGSVRCWGGNHWGQLGDGTITDRSVPVNVQGLSSGIETVSAGGGHTCAVTTDGGVKCWGGNPFGELGDGTTTDHLTPVDVSGLSNGIAAVSAGAKHTCALTTGGGVKCWGWNRYGTLGDGTTTDRLTPVDVVGLSSGVMSINAAYDHTCALLTSGGVKCWGWNGEGQLGNLSIDYQSAVPVDVCLDSNCATLLISGVTSLSASGLYTCAATPGSVKCWGLNVFGAIPDPCWKACPFFVPVDLPNSAGFTPVGAGGEMSAAMTPGGAVKYWGWFHITATDISGWTSGISAFSVGGLHICALATDGAVSCFGSNRYGQLGNGDSSDYWVDSPVQVIGLNGGSIPPTPTASPTPDCTAAPAKPSLLSPANNGSTNKTRPTLKWNAANCADTYNVTVKDAATGKKADKATGLTALKYKTKILTNGRTYKWFVKACNAIGCTKSAQWKFTIK